MYVDTKNLTAASTMAQQQQQQLQPAATTVPKNQMRRMRKVWQPLKRLLTVGGKGRPTQLTLVHPNNVDLNNTQQQQQQQHHLQLEEFTDDESKSTLELDASSTSSSPLLLSSPSDKIVEQVVDLTPPPNTPTLISSVYVEKVSINQGCRSCQHGRNCQHTHHQTQSQSQSQSQFQPQSNGQSLVWDNLPLPLPLPLQYISTDNGTFFWANTQERVDDDLLHAWLCQSFSQLPGTLC